MDGSTRALDSVVSSDDWSERCEHWLNAAPKAKRKRRERQARPLILTGHGISIAVDKGTLLIKAGNTHFPGDRREYRYFKGDLNLPPRFVMVDGSGAITLDALDWLLEQHANVVRLGWDGRVISVIGASGYAADKKTVEWQITTRANQAKRLEFAIPLITKKIKATLFNLRTLLPPSPSREKAIETAKNALANLEANPVREISKLLAIEGTVAQGYFFAWRALELRWKAESRYPVPENWKSFFSRSSLTALTRIKNVNANHPINAMLNYAYGVLESSVRIDVVAEGYDPSVGIMHDRNLPHRHSFVFDLMEPKRPIVDRAVLRLIAEQKFSGADFVLQQNGICRLNPELARHVVREVMALL